MLTAYAWLVTTLLSAGIGGFFIGVYALQFLALESGFRIGCRNGADRAGDKDGISTLTSGMLGLLGFTLGLTISFAQTRFEARRDSVLQEANTIGTAWLRADLLESDDSARLRHAIEGYAATRLAFIEAKTGEQAARQTALSNEQQGEIWRIAAGAARAKPTPVAASVIASLNDMIDASLTQRFTFESGLPSEVGAMLMAGSFLALGAMGYQLGLDRRRRVGLTALLLAMWTGGMTVTADLSSPRMGEIRANSRPLVWTIQGFGGGH